MRAALYLRVSTAEQVEKFSLSAQRRLLAEYAERQGWEYEIYEDAGISGETLDARPEMLRLLHDARAGCVQVAVAIEVERFSRSQDLLDWLVIKQAFRQGAVRFGTPAQLYDPADEEDDFLTDLFGALSKREKRKILARTLRGKLEAARRGRYIAAHVPYGYRRAGHGEGRLVIHDVEAEVVRAIFRLALDRTSTRAIAAELARQGVPTPHGRAQWARSTIQGILTNTAYVGAARYNVRHTASNASGTAAPRAVVQRRPADEWIHVPVPSIITTEMFAQAQEQFQKNRALARRNQRRPYLLKGLVRCGQCGHPMVGMPFRGVRFHRCQSRHNRLTPRCESRSVRAEALEAVVWDHLTTMLRNPDVRRWQDGHVNERDELEMRLAAVRAHLAKMPEERARLLRAYREQWASEEEYKTQLIEVRRTQAHLETQRDTLESRLLAGRASPEQAMGLAAVLDRAGPRLEALTFDERFQVVHAFVQRVIVHVSGAVEIHAFAPDATTSSGVPWAVAVL